MADIIDIFISDHQKIKLAIDRYAKDSNCISEDDILKEVGMVEGGLDNHIIVFDTDEYWERAIKEKGTPEVFCSLNALEALNTALQTSKAKTMTLHPARPLGHTNSRRL